MNSLHILNAKVVKDGTLRESVHLQNRVQCMDNVKKIIGELREELVSSLTISNTDNEIKRLQGAIQGFEDLGSILDAAQELLNAGERS